MQLNHLDHQLTRRFFMRWFSQEYIELMNKYHLLGSSIPELQLTPSEHSPIIIMGMHRSGTSLLVDALTELGLFSGNITGPDTSESLFFQYINDGALTATQSHWSTPENISPALKNDAISSCLSATFDRAVRSKWAHIYKFKHPQRALASRNGQFGWKDPRNCLTIPLWATLFPNARYVFIHRHGIDVAQSHVNRELRVGNTKYVARCLDIKQSFGLWEEYNHQALQSFKSIPSSKVLKFGFEELVTSPEERLADIADFCALPRNQRALDKFAKRCNPKKAFEYTKTFRNRITEQDLEFYQRSDTLKELCYTL